MTTITRRHAIFSLATLAAVAGAGSALALPAILQPADASPVLAATAEEFVRLLEALPPMKRLFVTQQIQGWDADDGYLNIFREKVPPDEVWNEVYPDWLSGFDDSIIAKFESGEWRVRI